MISIPIVSFLIALFIKYLHTNNSYILNVCSSNDFVIKHYSSYKTNYKGDSGIDLIVPYNGTIKAKSYAKIEHDATFILTKNSDLNVWNFFERERSYSYYLYARSSLSTIPLIIPNAVGIIDAGFRGKLSTIIYNPNEYDIMFKQGDKFSQVCANDLSEITVKINCGIPNYGTRGENGFGSTSKN
jgi:dUTPase